jgi:hypothetical protein
LVCYKKCFFLYDELSPWLGPIVTLTSSTGFLSFLVPSSFSSQTAFREAAYDSLFFIFHSIIFTCLKKSLTGESRRDDLIDLLPPSNE